MMSPPTTKASSRLYTSSTRWGASFRCPFMSASVFLRYHTFHSSKDSQSCFLLRLRPRTIRSEEHTSELQSRGHLVCRLLLEKKKTPHGLISRDSCAQ